MQANERDASRLEVFNILHFAIVQQPRNADIAQEKESGPNSVQPTGETPCDFERS